MNELAVREGGVPSIAELTAQDIRQYICKQANDIEIRRFLEVCKGNQLNPFLNDAYLVKYGTSPAQIIVGKGYFTKNAQKAPRFSHFEAGIIVVRDGSYTELIGTFKTKADDLVGGWAKVYLKDSDSPFYHTVSMDEYSKKQSTWKTMPSTMIRKVALVQCLREAFPEELEGIYDTSELPAMQSSQEAAQPTSEAAIDAKVEEMKTVETEDVTARVKKGLIHLKFTDKEQERVLWTMVNEKEFSDNVLGHLIDVAKSKDLEEGKRIFFEKAWVRK